MSIYRKSWKWKDLTIWWDRKNIGDPGSIKMRNVSPLIPVLPKLPQLPYGVKKTTFSCPPSLHRLNKIGNLLELQLARPRAPGLENSELLCCLRVHGMTCTTSTAILGSSDINVWFNWIATATAVRRAHLKSVQRQFMIITIGIVVSRAPEIWSWIVLDCYDRKSVTHGNSGAPLNKWVQQKATTAISMQIDANSYWKPTQISRFPEPWRELSFDKPRLLLCCLRIHGAT